MKHFLYFSISAIMAFAFGSCVAPQTAATSNTTTTTTATTQSTAQQDALGSLLNGVVSSTSDQTGSLGGVLGNIISSVTGSLTTTQANLIGTWTYSAPAVQFESENLLTQAGGATAATSVEQKLESYYQKVGIKPGKMVFTFTQNNQMTCQIGSRTIAGTYTFDSTNKMVTLTSSTTGLSLNAYVTISGNNMSLCFDSSKLLSLVSTVSSAAGNNSQSLLGNLGTLAQSFSGMKTGFKFTK